MIDWNEPPPQGYWRNARGDLIRDQNVSGVDRDADAAVRRIHTFGAVLSAEMWRFRTHTLDDIYGFIDRVAEHYGAKIGGRKGNVQICTFDGRLKVILAQADVIDVGPEIHAAQALVEECVDEWSTRGNLKLRALVDQAFKPDATGRLSVTHLLRLRRIVIDDDKWRQVQTAIGDALRPTGRAEYIRLYRRDAPTLPWEQVPLHLAMVRPPPAPAAGEPEAQLARRVRSAIEQAQRAGLSRGAVWEVLRGAVARRRPLPRAAVPAAESGPEGEAA